jgi:hypothetical protein
MALRYTLTYDVYKYRSDAPVDLAWDRAAFSLAALRNETVACQLVIQPDEKVLATLGASPLLHWTPTPRLRVSLGEIEGPDGQTWPAAVTPNWVGLVRADTGAILVADPLLPEESIEVAAGMPQALWLSLRLPADAPAGRYTLPITLLRAADFEDEEVIGAAEVTLEVAPLALPDPHDFRHFLDLWQHPTGLARGHHVPLWSEAHWALVERYAAEMARIGQKSITIIASDSPWAGQRCRYDVTYPSTLHEFNIVGIYRQPDGTLRFDFSRLDRYVEAYLRAGIDGEIEVIGLLAAWDDEFGRPLVDHPDNIRLACYDEESGRITWLRRQADLREYLQALGDHLKERGWWEITRFTADEPSHVELFRQRIDFLHSVLPDAKAKIPFYHMEMGDHFLNDVADWVPVIHGMGRQAEASQRLQAAVQARCDRFCWYVCCGPARPNNFITSPSIEARTQGWFSAWAGLDGFLRWAFTCWPADPWGRPGFRFPGWPTGDMFFVYPGRDGQPVRSLRLEMILAGIQDYELIALARQRAAAEPAIAAALERAFARVLRAADLAAFAEPDQTPPQALYSLDPEDYIAARAEIVAALQKA